MKKHKARKPAVAAVIEFSSNTLRLLVGDRRDDRVHVLEFLEYPLAIGKDTFNLGKLGFDKVNKACLIIKGYLETAACYGVGSKDIRVIATTALREARNKGYILDQIRLKTGLDVEIMDGLEEKLHIFKTALRTLVNEDLSSALMGYVGSGSVGISIIKNGRIVYYRSVKVGPLRISELFEHAATYTQEYHVMIEEFIRAALDVHDMPDGVRPEKLILTGGDVNIMKDLCGAENAGAAFMLKKKNLEKLYNRVKYASTENISKEYQLSLARAEVIIPACCILGDLFSLAGAEEALLPQAYLNESVLYCMLFPEEAAKIDKEFYKSTLLAVKALAARYEVIEAHASLVEDFSLKIFDKIRKLHGMGARERILLQCAAYLHDFGKFIDVKDHARHSYNILSGLDIVGLNQRDMNVLAQICLLHSADQPDTEPYSASAAGDMAVTAKLAAILRLADALDRGRLQKINDLTVTADGDELVVHVQTNRNIELEKWAFNRKSAFFGEVFGVKATLHVKAV
ncbi:MAG: HD domain-containing protein [Clostridiales bacterium]|jgi:exopolyphosphatase/guanosine-5'-triphosphate,3'-diphosphate pyrophosphatase|nr:HD domain-containing protein [Clostridiales bacterium]